MPVLMLTTQRAIEPRKVPRIIVSMRQKIKPEMIRAGEQGSHQRQGSSGYSFIGLRSGLPVTRVVVTPVEASAHLMADSGK